MNNGLYMMISDKEVRENTSRTPVSNLLITLAFIMVLAMNPVTVKANTNKDLSVATTYISRHYPGYKVRFVPEGKTDCLCRDFKVARKGKPKRQTAKLGNHGERFVYYIQSAGKNRQTGY